MLAKEGVEQSWVKCNLFGVHLGREACAWPATQHSGASSFPPGGAKPPAEERHPLKPRLCLKDPDKGTGDKREPLALPPACWQLPSSGPASPEEAGSVCVCVHLCVRVLGWSVAGWRVVGGISGPAGVGDSRSHQPFGWECRQQGS